MVQQTISADELAYHRRLAAQLRAAQAAWESWSAHLVAKYELGPDDGISESGEVVRGRTERKPA